MKIVSGHVTSTYECAAVKVLFRSTYRLHWVNKYGVHYEWSRRGTSPYSVKILRKKYQPACSRKDGLPGYTHEWVVIPKKFKKLSDVVKWANIGKKRK
jgi:hypothetical protein